MRIIYICARNPLWPSRSSTTCPMPTFIAVTRSRLLLRDLRVRASDRSVLSGRAGFIAITVGLHLVVAIRADAHAFTSARPS